MKKVTGVNSAFSEQDSEIPVCTERYMQVSNSGWLGHGFVVRFGSRILRCLGSRKAL
jgi:hypothetical protein